MFPLFFIFLDNDAHKKTNIIHNNVPLVQSVNHNEYIPAPIVSPPLVNNLYHNQVQHPHVVIPSIIQHPGYVIPPNMVCYASPPIQATYPQQILIPSNAVHTFTPAGHFYPVVSTQQMVTGVTHSDNNVIQQNGIIQPPILDTVIENFNDSENVINNEDPISDVVPILFDNHTEQKIDENEPTIVSPSQAVVQNGLKPATSPSPGKSWASLFSSSNKSQQQNGFMNNYEDNVERTNKPVLENEVSNIVCPIKHPKKSAQFVDPDCYRMGGKYQSILKWILMKN